MFQVTMTSYCHKRGFVYSHGAWLDARSSHQERNPHVKLEREGFPFDKTELSKMVAMIWRVNDVGIVQLSEGL